MVEIEEAENHVASLNRKISLLEEDIDRIINNPPQDAKSTSSSSEGSSSGGEVLAGMRRRERQQGARGSADVAPQPSSTPTHLSRVSFTFNELLFSVSRCVS